MAARDNVLFHASIASGTAAGTVVPLTLLYGIENVRQGYGTAKLKNIRGIYSSGYSSSLGVPVEIKNSNWIDSAGLVAQKCLDNDAFSRYNLAFMRGRDKELAPNTSWTIFATLPANTTSIMELYVLLEIEYSDVAGLSTENAAGSPVRKLCKNASVTGAANTLVPIGTFDNLLQNIEYVLSEVSLDTGADTYAQFVVLEGFGNQRGLVRIFPAKSTGMADPVEGSVKLTKQTYNVSVIRAGALSAAAVTVGLEMIASKN